MVAENLGERRPAPGDGRVCRHRTGSRDPSNWNRAGADGPRPLEGPTRLRHVGLLEEAQRALERAAIAVRDGATEEVVLVELGEARKALEAITGRTTADDLLHHVFGRFCIGK
jgi:hypothetical protein